MADNPAAENPTTAQHTPGPWVIDGNRIRTDYIRFEGAVRGVCVAQVDKAGVGTPQAEANARLMAAAPELLAALKDILACPNWHPEFSGSLWNNAVAAIARAEGRQP